MTLPRCDRRLVYWLSVAQLISWGSVFYAFGVLLEPMEQALGLTRAQSSLAFSLALLAEGVMAWPVGRWIDRGHERAVMTGGSLLLCIGLLLLSGVGSLAGFYAAWTLLGAGLAATLYTPAFAVVTRRCPLDFRRAIITLTFLGGLASTVFIPIVAWGVAHVGWRSTLWGLAALHLLVCAPLHAHWLRGAPAPVRLAPPAGGTERAEPGVRTLMRSGPFLLIGLFTVLLMAVTAALPPHLVSLLRGAGLDERWAIALPASIGIVQVIGRALLYVLERRIDPDRANRWIPCLLPLAIAVLLGGAGHPGAAFAFVVLYGLGNGLLTIVKGTAVAQYVSRTHMATLNGALGLPTALSRAIAPWMLGMLWTPTAGYTTGLWVLLAACAVAVAAMVGAQQLSRARPTVTGGP